MFKVYHGLCNVTVGCMFPKTSCIHNVSTRSASQNFFVQSCRTNVRLKFCVYEGVKLWNELPASIKLCNTLNMFKLRLYGTLFATYT